MIELVPVAQSLQLTMPDIQTLAAAPDRIRAYLSLASLLSQVPPATVLWELRSLMPLVAARGYATRLVTAMLPTHETSGKVEWTLPDPDTATGTDPVISSPSKIDDFVFRKWREDLLWRLFNDFEPTPIRLSALVELAAVRDRSLPAFLTAELRAGHTDLEWLAGLVVATEQIQFSDDRDRDIVKGRLKLVVEQVVQTRDQRWEPVAWSAIRTHASMLSPQEAVELADYLPNDGVPETRIVTLQAIQNVFYNAPPADGLNLQRLRDAVAGVADLAFQASEPLPGDHAALAQEATFALAAVGDARLQGACEWAARWGRQWFTRQVRVGLEEIVGRWANAPLQPSDNSVLTRIKDCVAHLHRHEGRP